MNSTTTISSNEVAKANSAPETSPGRINGTITRKNTVGGGAPRLAAARIRLVSNPASVAATVTKTNGAPSAVWARISPT